ncbi:hypothetical protein [Pseudoflavitalea rhizosphaerae]|uniref:hypothetical protein n=1 Tax=Pseudoflavitalea rhizosphaerae TaxID=1884793 RepID=UPI000F8E710B|nr:hypothetical protein [Pseudoflavitalea rhizosphaerae]
MEKISSRAMGIYLVKLWLISVGVIAPVFLALLAASKSSSYLGQNSGVSVIFVFALFGLLFSLPTLLVTALLCIALFTKFTSDTTLKIVIDLVVILGIFINIHTVGFNELANTYILSYAVSVVIASLFIPLRKAI